MRFFIFLSLFILVPTSVIAQVRAPLDGVSPTLRFDPTLPKISLPNNEDIHFFGAITGMGVHETNNSNNSPTNYGDITNAQFSVEKNKGDFQFFALAGAYSFPTLGQDYQRSYTNTVDSFGFLPLGWVTYAPNANFSINVGKLLAPGGGELDFTYSNYNVQSGLLAAQTNIITKGVQANYTHSALTAQFSLSDGSYSNTYNWLSGLFNFSLANNHDVAVSWAGSVSGNATNTSTTPLLLNNSQITNLIYNYNGDHWALSPYLQYTVVQSNPTIGIQGTSGTQGIALTGAYRVFPKTDGHKPKTNISFPLRLEYINSWGSPGQQMTLLYGPNSSAWSATFTPTYYTGPFFVRGEVSYVAAIHSTPGYALGYNQNAQNQGRFIIETGFLF